MTTAEPRAAERATVRIETTAKGLLAKLAHDLSIDAADVSAEATIEGDRASVTLTFPVRSLSVKGVRKRGVVDASVLSASDRSDIERKIREEVLTSADVVVTASATVPTDEGKRCVPTTATVEASGRKATAPFRRGGRDARDVDRRLGSREGLARSARDRAGERSAQRVPCRRRCRRRLRARVRSLNALAFTVERR